MTDRPIEILRNIRHVVMDMDGTIYHGARLFPTTLPFLAQLRELGIGFTFLTNNSSRSTGEYLKHLTGFGIEVPKSAMLTSTRNTVDWLRNFHPEARRLFLLGTPAFRREMVEEGFADAALDEEPDAVVTAFDTGLAYERLCKSAWWIKHGKLWVATHCDPECPTDLPTTLVDCGSITACLEHVSGRRAVVLGKPQKAMMETVLRAHNLRPDEVVMCGDRLYTDIQLAVNSGTWSCHIAAVQAPDSRATWTLPHLGMLGDMLRRASVVSSDNLQ